MISKLGSSILVAVVGLFFATPSDVSAASSKATKNKIKKLFTQLKKLPNGASPAGKVSSLVKKLSKLDSKKANTYYKVGLTKLAKSMPNKNAVNNLTQAVVAIVKNSGLPTSQINKITKQVNQEDAKFSPTPITNQAMILFDNFFSTAHA